MMRIDMMFSFLFFSITAFQGDRSDEASAGIHPDMLVSPAEAQLRKHFEEIEDGNNNNK